MKVIEGAEEFFLAGSNGQGVLLIHGYTGTPAEMRLLGEHLQREGYTVLGVRLPGHGTVPQELNETSWQEWYAEVEQGFYRLQQQCSKVMVAGLSMGGLLAMVAAVRLPAAKAVFMAAPIFVQDWRAPLLPLLKYFIHYLKKKKRNYFTAEKYNIAYNVMPVKPLSSLFALTKFCKEEILPQITIPCLVMQSTVEHTVKPSSASYIYEHLGSRDKYLVWYKRSGHILTLDVEREDVFKTISEFFRSEQNEQRIIE